MEFKNDIFSVYRVKRLNEKPERNNWKRHDDWPLYKKGESCELQVWAFAVELCLTTVASVVWTTMPKFRLRSSQLLVFIIRQKNNLILSHQTSIGSVSNS